MTMIGEIPDSVSFTMHQGRQHVYVALTALDPILPAILVGRGLISRNELA
jgi:hypothetical protein